MRCACGHATQALQVATIIVHQRNLNKEQNIGTGIQRTRIRRLCISSFDSVLHIASSFGGEGRTFASGVVEEALAKTTDAVVRQVFHHAGAHAFTRNHQRKNRRISGCRLIIKNGGHKLCFAFAGNRQKHMLRAHQHMRISLGQQVQRPVRGHRYREIFVEVCEHIAKRNGANFATVVLISNPHSKTVHGNIAGGVGEIRVTQHGQQRLP